MAVTAKQIEKSRANRAREVATFLENYIDKYLQQEYSRNVESYTKNLKEFWTHHRYGGEIRVEVVRMLVDKYKEAGWCLSYDSTSTDLTIHKIGD